MCVHFPPECVSTLSGIRSNPADSDVVRTKDEYEPDTSWARPGVERGILEFTLSSNPARSRCRVSVLLWEGESLRLGSQGVKQHVIQNVKSHFGVNFWVEAGLRSHNSS
jgi:hypothetical protein